MSHAHQPNDWSTRSGVDNDLHGQHLYLRLAENALFVAENLRGNYFRNTAEFVRALRLKIASAERNNESPILGTQSFDDLTWDDVRGEVVTFIDGGVGQVQISSQVPILLRVGSYAVRTGERRISERESFGYYPVILGDLEGGSKDRQNFSDLVRITAELLGGLSAVERTPDLDVLMFHGPLIEFVGTYAGHSPFTEQDIDLFLNQYGHDAETAHQLKEDFLTSARLDVYPAMTDRSDEWVRQRLFEPLAFLAFLYQRLIARAKVHPHKPVIASVVERSDHRMFIESILMPRVFRGLREKDNLNWFNELFGRSDLTTEKTVLDRLGYTDSLLLGMLLRPGQATESWLMPKYVSLQTGSIQLPSEGFRSATNWAPLRPPSPFGFPNVLGCYLQVSETTDPIRIEVFEALGQSQLARAAQHAYLYARLLPGYGFPVGLDVVDKFARVPTWLTDAYGKLIRHQLGVSLQQGDISDAEMRRILIQSIYITHRDWLFRPTVDGVS